MLHLNKRSCIVTNLIGIQWFTRESIVSRHGMVRGITKDRIEGTSVSGMQRWMKAQTGRRYFFLCSLPAFAVEMLILSRGLVPFTQVNAALVSRCEFQKRVFSFSFLVFFSIVSCPFLVTLGIYRHSARQLESWFLSINLTICLESCRGKLRRSFKRCGYDFYVAILTNWTLRQCVEQNEMLVRSSRRIKNGD